MKALPRIVFISALLLLTSALLTNVAFSGQVEKYGNGSLEATPGTPQAQFFLPIIGFGQSFTVSGQVTDQNDSPIANAAVVDSTGRSTMTDASGHYALSGLPAGSISLAPSKEGYVFSPSLAEVKLPGLATGLDFTALTQCSELIVNGGFENDQFWEMPLTPYPSAYTTSAAHSGTRSVRTGIVQPADNIFSYSSVRPEEAFTVPANSTGVTLRLWLYPVTGEVATTASGVKLPVGTDFGTLELAPQDESGVLSSDLQYVVILDENNVVLETLLGMLSDAAQWQLYQFDLTKYTGEDIKIHVGTFNDGIGGVTHMFVDDVSVEACPDEGVEPTPTPNPTVIPPNCANQMLNSGFENNNGWVIPITEFSAGYSTDQAHAGTRSMRTGITGSTADKFSYSDAYQLVDIPSSAASATLSLWIYPSSGETATVSLSKAPAPGTHISEMALSSDAQYVLVLDTNGFILQTLMLQLSNAQQWTLKNFDLTGYKGSTIRIQFGTFNDGDGSKSSMYVDDATLVTCASLTPTPSPTPTTIPPTPTPTNTPIPGTQPAPTATPSACAEGLLNNSFENNNGWYIPVTEFSAGYSTTRAHTGSRSMRTGIEFAAFNRFSYSDFGQVVMIPTSADSVQLRMWTWSKSQEVAALSVLDQPMGDPLKLQSSGSDVQYLLVLDWFGNWIDTLLWQLSDARQWEYDEFDLSLYGGQTIKLQFGTYNNGIGGVTSMFVDDVSLQVCP